LTYGAFSVFGLAVVVVSTQSPHRLWGACAVAAYGCAALVSLTPLRRRRELALVIAVAGALVVPLCWLAATGRGMPEVGVVAHSAELLVQHGRPYLSAARLGANVNGYNPYLPGMTLFGLPRALAGGGVATDPRVWDGLAFVAAFAAALRTAGGTRPVRRTAALASSPLIAFPLTVSGNDLPVLGLICLGLALAARPDLSRPPSGTPVHAGVVLGATAALKATAWPALLIVGVLVLARDGRGAAARFAGSCAAVLAVVVGPTLLIQPGDLAENTIAFPLGLTRAHSPAASPLPGHLIAATGPAGHLAVIALMVAGAAGLGVLLIARPPRTAVSAAGYLVLTLTMLFVLAPATRWGYFVYPAGIGCWLLLSGLVAPWNSGTPRHSQPGVGARDACVRSG
jgi:Glycosyltransferase family 87